MQVVPLFPLTEDDIKHPQFFECVDDLQRIGVMPGTRHYQLSELLARSKDRKNGFAKLAVWYDGNWCWLYDYGRKNRVIHCGQAKTAYHASNLEKKHYYPMEGHPALEPCSL